MLRAEQDTCSTLFNERRKNDPTRRNVSRENQEAETRVTQKSIGTTVAVAGAGAVAVMQATKGTAHASGAETATDFSDTRDPVVTVTNTSSGSNVKIGGGTHGIVSTVSDSLFGIVGRAIDGTGVLGDATTGFGAAGQSSSGNGLVAISAPGAPTDHPTALRVLGTIKVGVDLSQRDNPVGTATLAFAASSVTVNNPVATPNSIVILTPQSDPGGTVWVTTTTGSFTIHRAVSFFPLHPAVTFNYLIIN